MSDQDDQLATDVRKALDGLAEHLTPRTDWDDLTRRRVRREQRRTKILSGVVVAALIVGSGAGYALGNTDDGTVIDAGGSRARRAAPRDGLHRVEATPAPTVPGRASGTSDSYGEDSVSLTATVVPTPLGRAFVRTTNTGVVLRVYRGALAPRQDEMPAWADPPGWCFPTGVVYVGASTELAVGAVHADSYDELRENQVNATAHVVGLTEAAPVRVVVVQAPAGAGRVEARFPGGASDDMAPIDGIAVLAAPASEAPTSDALHTATIDVQALSADGSVMSRTTVAPTVDVNENYDAGQDACRTDQLPPPGDEQPPDVDAARAAVVDVYRRNHDGSAPPEDRALLLDDPNGFVDITRQIADEFGEPALTAQLSDIELVFTTPTRAAVRYTLVATSGEFPFFGEAVLTDDGWKMTRATWCNEILMAGKRCP